MINENYKGKLLISSPEISDGVFDKSIILICEHDANGTMGFILNKPLINVSLETIWTNIGYEKKNPYFTNENVLIGGPLASNAMFVIHSPEYFIDKKTIKKKISQLSKNKEVLIQKKIKSKEWVKKYHDIQSVCSSLYNYYQKNSWMR